MIIHTSLLVKTPCCPETQRRHNHNHLNHLPNIRTFWPSFTEYVGPSVDILMVIERLSMEDRRLDQIKGGKGSLEEAIAKELYGNESHEFAR